jgi:hypothetical protein
MVYDAGIDPRRGPTPMKFSDLLSQIDAGGPERQQGAGQAAVS